MISELRTWGLIGFVLVVWAALVAASLVSGNSEVIGTISEGVPVLLVLVLLFDRVGWKWGPLHPFLVATPVLIGTWRGELTSLWMNADQAHPTPKIVYLAVEQTLTSVRIWLFTDEQDSEQIAGEVAKIVGNRWALAYVFRGEPRIDRRARNVNPMHHGGALLKVIEGGTRSLEGEYWNERAAGKLVLRDRSAVVARSFEQAASLDYAA